MSATSSLLNPAQRSVLESELYASERLAEERREERRFEDALRAREVAGDLAAALHGEESREMVRAAYELGCAHLDASDTARALACLQHALGNYSSVGLGRTGREDDAALLSDVYMALGNALSARHENAGAEGGAEDSAAAVRMYRRSREILDRSLGDGTPAAVSALLNEGIVHLRLGDPAAALVALRDASDRTGGSAAGAAYDLAAEFADLEHCLGCAKHALGDLVPALAHYARSLSARLAADPADDLAAATTYHNVAQIYQEQGKVQEALRLHLKARRVRETRLGVAHPDTGETYFHLGLIYGAMGRTGEAAGMFARAARSRGKRDPRAKEAATLARTAKNSKPGAPMHF